jgi:alpha-1,6-mannosyltransferase
VLSAVAFGGGALAVIRQIVEQQRLVANFSAPNVMGDAVGLHGITPALRAIDGLVLVSGIALPLWRTWHGANWLAAAGWATLLLLVTSAWLVPWYVVWLLPFAAVAGTARLCGAALSFAAFVVTTRVTAHF